MLYHIAPDELDVTIEANGLDPVERAILLISERPGDVDGFTVWEVDTDLTAGDDIVLADRKIHPESLRRSARSNSMSI